MKTKEAYYSITAFNHGGGTNSTERKSLKDAEKDYMEYSKEVSEPMTVHNYVKRRQAEKRDFFAKVIVKKHFRKI